MKRKLPLTFRTCRFSCALAAKLPLIAAALIALCFSGCVVVNFAEPGSTAPAGRRETYEFKVGEFNRVKIEGFFDTRFYSAPSDTVKLEVQPNIMEYYSIEVIDGELIVRTTRSISFGFNNSPILTISSPKLDRITFEGVGSFTAYDKITADSLTFIFTGAGNGKAELDTDFLSAEISGTGKLELSGRANTANLELSGTGELSALRLQTNDANIDLSGTGTIRVSCSENLRINADGVGTVEYRGSPRVNINKDGLVTIRQVN